MRQLLQNPVNKKNCAIKIVITTVIIENCYCLCYVICHDDGQQTNEDCKSFIQTSYLLQHVGKLTEHNTTCVSSTELYYITGRRD